VHREHRFGLGPPATCQVIGDPREWWPRESAFLRWLLGNPGPLAECLGLGGLEFCGREVVAGEQGFTFDSLGRGRFAGGLRLDAAARDERGRLVIIEAQLGPADHAHLGQLVTYAHWGGSDTNASRNMTKEPAGHKPPGPRAHQEAIVLIIPGRRVPGTAARLRVVTATYLLSRTRGSFDTGNGRRNICDAAIQMRLICAAGGR